VTQVRCSVEASGEGQARLALRFRGRGPRAADAMPGGTTADWVAGWMRATPPELDPESAGTTNDEIVVGIAPCFDLAAHSLPASPAARVDAAAAHDTGAAILDEVRRIDRALRAARSDAAHASDELSRLSRELEETNRGVVALCAELDERADELRRADRAKTRFLSNVSHELRTPLNSIQALAALLLDRLDGPLTDEQLKQVTFIHAAAGELRQTVDDLLDIAKIAAGRTEIQIESFDIATLFGALRGTLKPLLAGSAVSLHFEDASRLPPMVSDERKIAQILRNLVANALKFTEAGEVRVRAEAAPDAGSVRFEVADTGIGIAPEDRERIFEEFVQIANPLQARTKGTGLGLALCRRLTALLGGTIDVAGGPGRGSCFSVLLPRVLALDGLPRGTSPPQAAFAAAPETGRTAEAASIRVLLIDDDPAARYAVRRRLEDDGAVVVEAEDGARGLAAVAQFAPDLVVLDLELPDVHGAEVLRRLRRQPHGHDLPVAVLTSVETDAVDGERLQGERAAVLSKKAIGDSDFGRRLLELAVRQPRVRMS
jgi:signal transduction histidine kinase/CheY-like chemotaxis protein